jgi:general secretion pathway protein J
VRAQPARGFTLLEMLVALAIFAVIGVMAYGGLSAVIQQREAAEAQADRWREIQFAMRVLVRDLQQWHPRPVRDELGDRYEPSLRSSARTGELLAMTRAGWNNPGGLPRGTLQRVAYQLDAGRLLRVYWPMLDRTLSSEPIVTELLTDVDQVQLRLLGTDNEWRTEWPPLGAEESAYAVPPRAVEITLELPDQGVLTRVVEVGP